jgi:hypothetical protein
MVLLAEDPNLAIRPDFTSELHQAAREQLLNDLVDEAQAAHILSTLWNISNNAAKIQWEERLAAEARMTEEVHQRAAEEELERRLAEEEEQSAILLEERKKNKAKYIPFRNVDVPSEPIIIPSYYATRKMKKGDFCELFYFTNKGLDDASKSNLTSDPEALVLLPSADGQHSWIPAGAARDPKTPVYDDEDLSWEEFNEAAPRMINSMRDNGWPDARMDMHIKFWSALQNHRWRHSRDKTKQRALLVYQGVQRKRWHLAIAGPNSYSLANINQELLDETKEDLLDQSRNRAALAASQVRFLFPPKQWLASSLPPPFFFPSPTSSPSPPSFHLHMRANHVPSHYAGRSCTLAPFSMRVDHVPSHPSPCGSIMYPRAPFNAGQTRTLALTPTSHEPHIRLPRRPVPHQSAATEPPFSPHPTSAPNGLQPTPPNTTAPDSP